MFRSLTNRRLPKPFAIVIAALLALYFVPLAALPASADTVGGFEIEGNLADDPAVSGIDWATVDTTSSDFATDVDHTTGGQDDTTFGGGSKEYNDGGSNGWPAWVYGGGNAPGKSDFGRWATYTNTDASSHVWLFLGFDRDFAQGTAKYAFELNQVIQSNVDNPNTTRSQGDLRFIVWDQGNGKITLTGDDKNGDVGLYKWVDPDQAADGVAADTDNDGHWVKNASNGTFVGAVNSGAVSVPSWWTSKNVTSGTIGTDKFVEFGVDLTSFGAVLGCPSSGFSAVNARSITGTGTTGALVDYLSALPVHIPSTCTSLVTDATDQVVVGDGIMDTATITPSSATGTVTFKVYGPDDATCANAPVTTLGPVDVVDGEASSGVYTPTQVGTYRWIAFYDSDDEAHYADSAGECNDPDEVSVVVKKQPGISTDAEDGAQLLSNDPSINDVATVTNLTANAGGTVTFKVYGPDDTDCSGAVKFDDTKPLGTVTNGTATVTSGDYTPTAAGTYRWVASYSGDASNKSVAGACNDANESSVVDKTSPTITTDADDTAKLPYDATVSDSATLAGVTAHAGGTITFKLFGPDATPATPTCTEGAGGNLVFTSSAVAVGGPGSYGPVNTSVDKAGTYFWVAYYSGDDNNSAVAGVCGDPTETSDVDKASPSIETTASDAGLPQQSSISDTAHLTDLTSDATGTVTFNVWGPFAEGSAATCSGAPFATKVVALPSVGGDHVVDVGSGAVTVTTAGTYFWVASYSGDSNNEAVTGSCGDENETSVVTKGKPTIVTVAAADDDTLPGSSVKDTATVSGLTANATGSVTFTLYSDVSCSTVVTTLGPVALGTVTNGSASATSSSYTGLVNAGTYYFIASYSGDVNNESVSGKCGDADESVTIKPAQPTISTVAVADDDTLLGTSVKDTATVSGLTANATGSVTFTLYSDASCDTLVTTLGPVAIGTVSSGTASATSSSYTGLTEAGTYYFIASYSGDDNNKAVSGKCGDDDESVTIQPAQPTIATVAVADDDRLPGTSVEDTATVSGLTANATGSVTFTLYSDDTCATEVTTLGPVDLGTVTNHVASVESGSYTGLANTGTYYFIASYSGDDNNLPVSGACGDDNESVTIQPAQPTIATVAVADDDTLPGTSVKDTATVSGLSANATGSVSFTLYSDASCATPVTTLGPVELGTVTNHSASVESGSYTGLTDAGTYYFIASYSGDGNNLPVSGACGDENESVTIQPAQPSIATVAVAGAVIKAGEKISDGASVTGLNPGATGTVTFALYGPDDAICSGTPVFTSQVDLVVTSAQDGTATGAATSATFTPTAAGTYRWVATYSGDDNNLASAGACNDPNEQSVVKAGDNPGLDKFSNPVSGSTVQPGSTIHYSVKVSNTGDVAITNEDVVDVLPPHVTVVASTISDGGVLDSANGQITWKTTLAPGGEHTFTYDATVNADAPQGGILVNTAKFRNLQDTTSHVVPSGKLAITKAVSPVAGNGVVVEFGDKLTYTLTVSATGGLDQPNVVVTDYLPGRDPAHPQSGDTTYVAGTAKCIGAGTCTVTGPNASGLITWNLGAMAAGTTRQVTFQVTIDDVAGGDPGEVVAVDIVNQGAVRSDRTPTTPSNVVVTPVSKVLPVKIPRELPHTGALLLGRAAGGALVLLGVGLLLLVGSRRRWTGRA